MIPTELQQYPNWVCWKYITREGQDKPVKLPVNPITGKAADVTDPTTWTDYRTACHYVSNYTGLGFVLSNRDPFALIDLDHTDEPELIERQQKLVEAFDSYTEISPSGKGLHIIVKANVPSGRNRRPLEVYSSQRFMTVTGDVCNKTDIQPRQELTLQLWEQLAPTVKEIYNDHDMATPATQDDAAICTAAYNAKNGYKFYQLYSGNWQPMYGSQSDADFALISIIAFYTPNADQVARIFRSSALGQRDKAKRDKYVYDSIRKAYGGRLPSINLEALQQAVSVMGSPPPAPQEVEVIEQPEVAKKNPYYFPGGMLGAIAQFIYDAAPRPVHEIALAGAIGLMAGVAGKAYNFSGTGLNQYTLVLAPTGTGKEGAAKGIDKLMHCVSATLPSCMEFLGPSVISSPQALLKYLSGEASSFVSIIGECGLWLRSISEPNAPSHLVGVRSALLDLYSKSGQGQKVRPIIYSDKAKNTDIIQAPAFSIMGESTPERFYTVLDEDLISEGLIPRFNIIEYTGQRPPENEGHSTVMPPAALIANFTTLCQQAHTLNQAQSVVHVQSDEVADKLLREFNVYCDNQCNSVATDTLRQLWSRAYMKAVKLAALVAVGTNPYTPVIDAAAFDWAKDIIIADVLRMSSKFRLGLLGSEGLLRDNEQQIVVQRALTEYLRNNAAYAAKYGVPPEMHAAGVFPYAYLQRRLASQAVFRKDRRGGTKAIQEAARTLALSGVIVALPEQQSRAQFGFTGVLYAIPNIEYLRNRSYQE